MPLPPLPACSRAAYLASLGHPRQPGRWTRQAAMVALGLYVREEHRLPPQRHLHNSECLPSYDTVLALFGTPQAYYEALPPAWTLPLLPVARTPRGPNHYAPTPPTAQPDWVECLRCEQRWYSPDKAQRHICPRCTLTQDDDGEWMNGVPVVHAGLDEEDLGEDDDYGD